MKTLSIKAAVASLFVTGGLLAAASASATLVLNTTALQANAVLTFSQEAFGLATDVAKITFTPLGNAEFLGDVAKVDENGVPYTVPSYNLPVTKAEVAIGWDLSIKANSGSSTRSALKLERKGKTVVLANFVLDFRKQLLSSDFITGGVLTAAQPLYTFVEVVPQKVSIKGLVLNMNATVGKLELTPAAQTVFGTELALTKVMRDALPGLDWGTVAISVSTKLRKAVSDKPFTAADL